MMANFEEHRRTSYKDRWLYFTVVEDIDAGDFYAEIFDRQGKDVENLLGFDSKKEARIAAIRRITTLEGHAREVQSPAA